MGVKRKLLEKVISPLDKIANRFNWEVVVQNKYKDIIRTHYMYYDKVSYTLNDDNEVLNYKKYLDYCRYRTFELIVAEIKSLYTDEEINQFSVAEAGVFEGDFAWIINYYFSECALYLYDTYEGFDKGDVEIELRKKYTDRDYMEYINRYFGADAVSSDEKIKRIRSKMVTPDKCVFRKGYFPDTVEAEKDDKWVFVSLDMDLYKPIKEGIMFFWPRLVPGG